MPKNYRKLYLIS